MLIARVDGTAVAPIAHESVRGWRLLICQPLNDEGEDQGVPLVALDKFGAGLHEKVILSSDGAALRGWVEDPHSPLRYMTIGIIDPDGIQAGDGG